MFIDISKKLNNDIFVYENDPKFSCKETSFISDDGYCVHTISFGSHCGTHIDFPRHFFENGKTCDQIPIEKMCGKAIVIDINKNDILDKNFFSEKVIEENIIVALKFNCEPFGITYDGALYLKSLSIKMIVTESVDIEDYEDFRVHKLLLKSEILILECADLSSLFAKNCYIYAFPLNIEGCDASPVRAIAQV